MTDLQELMAQIVQWQRGAAEGELNLQPDSFSDFPPLYQSAFLDQESDDLLDYL